MSREGPVSKPALRFFADDAVFLSQIGNPCVYNVT